MLLLCPRRGHVRYVVIRHRTWQHNPKASSCEMGAILHRHHLKCAACSSSSSSSSSSTLNCGVETYLRHLTDMHTLEFRLLIYPAVTSSLSSVTQATKGSQAL